MKIVRFSVLLSIFTCLGFVAGVVWIRWPVLFPNYPSEPYAKARHLADRGLEESALEVYLDLYSEGDAHAAYLAANALDRGNYDLEASNALQIELLTFAAASGAPEAWHALANHYLIGKGVPKDFDKAMEYFERSVDEGYPQAWYHLAQSYAYGSGVRKDQVSVQKYYTLAAENGVGVAAFIVSATEILDHPEPHDLPTAFERVKASAKAGSVDAQVLLCNVAINPFVVLPRYYKWRGIAAKAGDKRALLRMGKLYEQACSDELYPHASYYSEELGVDRDIDIARRYYEMAVEAGSVEAGQRLQGLRHHVKEKCTYTETVKSQLFGYEIASLDILPAFRRLPPTPDKNGANDNRQKVKFRSSP